MTVAGPLGLASRNLFRHRTRTLISLSSIAFGVAALVLASGFMEWSFWAIRESTIRTGMGHVQVSRPQFHTAGAANPAAYLLPAAGPELDAARSAPGVQVLDERLMLSGLASHGETTVAFLGEAVRPDAGPLISPILPIVGENLSTAEPKGIIVGRGLAQTLGVRAGDLVNLVVTLPRGGIGAVEGRVLGTFATQVKSYDDTAVRMPLALGRELLRTRGSHVWVAGLADTDDDPGPAVRYLRERLPAAQFEVASWQELSDFYRKAVALLGRQTDVLAVLIALIIVLSITNTLTMNVLERTGEIGTLMALGARPAGILRLFVLEGVLLGIVGAIIGLAIGYALGTLLSAVGIPMPPPPGRDTGYSARIIMTPLHAAQACVLAFVATVLASIYPAWKAARLPIVDALRHNR